MQLRLLFAAVFLVFALFTPISAERIPTISAAARSLEATVTAYSSTRHQASRHPTITASGRHVRNGIVACPRRFPFGTKVRIAGKIYRCEDRLNTRFDNRFDIWKSNSAAARSFGKQELPVVVTEVPQSGTGEPADAR